MSSQQQERQQKQGSPLRNLYQNKWIVVLFLFTFSALSFLFLGFYARRVVLDANSCNMTYSSREQLEVQLYPHCGKHCAFKLFKVSNARKRGVLNTQPVLFVPGHLGSADQARSLASYMHDEDGHFQYFALDFGSNNTWESSAIHGSAVLAQAAATNQALLRIIRMYELAGVPLISDEAIEPRNKRIIIIGHSIGGLVARVALLMNNHPSDQCPVSDIVQLSSPNDRPPYSPDPSLELLYHTTKQAYRLSYLNRTNAACKAYRSRLLFPRMLHNITRVEYDYLCSSRCIPRARILSISGGEIDMQVTPRLTQLHDSYAVELPKISPKLLALKNESSNSRSSIGSVVFSVLLNPWSNLMHLVYPTPSGLSNSARSNDSDQNISGAVFANSSENNFEQVNISGVAVDVIGSTEEGVGSLSMDNVSVEAVVEDIADSEGVFTSMISNKELVEETTMSTAEEDQYLSSSILPILNIRMSQLTSVGFPTDHVAMVWCFQLISSITSILRHSTTTEVEEAAGSSNWIDRLPLALNRTDPTGEGGNFRGPMRFQLRDFHSAAAVDNAFIFNILDQHVVKTGLMIPTQLFFASFRFFSHHWTKIVVAYLVAGMLTLIVPLLRLMSGFEDPAHLKLLNKVTSYSLLQPWRLLSVDLLYVAVIYGVHRISLSPGIDQAPNLVAQLTVVLFLAKLLYDWYSLGSYYKVMLAYEGVAYWIVSFLVSLLVRGVILLLMNAVQGISHYSLAFFYAAARKTIYSKSIRRNLRVAMKTARQVILKSVPFAEAIFRMMQLSVYPMIPVAIWLSIFFATSARRYELGVLGCGSLYNLCIFSITFYSIMTAGVVAAILYCPQAAAASDKSDDSTVRSCHFFRELCMFYLPTPLFAAPSALFAIRVLFGDNATAQVLAPVIGSFRLFSTEMFLFNAALAAIGLHLWAMRYGIAMLDRVSAWRPLHDFIGPAAVEAVCDIYPLSVASLTPAVFPDSAASTAAAVSARSGPQRCIHEDGGKFAVYECILDSELPESEEKPRKVLDGVWIGSTYRVVSCACAKDYTLKEQWEWCDWCLCRRCGGKHLPARSCAKSRNQQYIETALITSDVVLLTALLGAVWFSLLYLEDQPFRYLHLAAFIAGTFYLSHVLHGKN